MIVLVTDITPRIRYTFEFIAKEITGGDIQLTTDRQEFTQLNVPRINYTKEPTGSGELFVTPHGLLSEEGIRGQQIDCFETNGYKAFFRTEGDWPFDVFAATFYLLSRYEEYLPHRKDEYGRYAHAESLAFREGFLDEPLVNRWLKDLRRAMSERFVMPARPSSFIFLPTYDIDIAWSYRQKGWLRTTGAFMMDVIKGRFNLLRKRWNVIKDRERDPFDSYGWLNQLHEKYRLKPYYFFLLARRLGRYDRNIDPSKPAMQKLLQDHLLRYPVGIHPSWRSGDEVEELKLEIDLLEQVSGQPVLSSRQHYIRFTLPQTFRKLLEHDIRFDFSMGYGSINGFRASVASPFRWFDLERNITTELTIFPFCFMEANSFYELKQTPQEALEAMKHYLRVVREVDGSFIMIWHNSFLGTDPLYSGWKECYEQFMEFAHGGS